MMRTGMCNLAGLSSPISIEIRDSCPHAEKIIRRLVRQLLKTGPKLAPLSCALSCSMTASLRYYWGILSKLLSLLAISPGVDTEKESPPYETLKGFGIIHLIRLVAHSIHFTLGGETVISYKDISTYELPSPPC
ncbi:uncharacterized protein LOC120011452 isoform X2 [Tripterygium wilfordii]|uniref:uncharacterized protein LOC120011452 isoform X2 n=1 Tax=Tripterygium wilfordii TaxID=458696 RepID=UPI0018F833E7|nr:uncharacterized protein LOC120011452 isoform X2 [Tripterygium wilfordii]